MAGSGGTAREIPNVGIHDIRPADDGRQHRSQAVTRRAVRMEIHRHFKIMFEQAYQPGHPFGRNQAAHILDRDHVGAERLHLPGFIQEIGVGKNFARQLLALEQRRKPLAHRKVRVDRIANRTIGQSTVFLYIFDGRFDVLHIVQRIEDTHDAETGFDRIAAKSFDNFIGIGAVPEQGFARAKGPSASRHHPLPP